MENKDLVSYGIIPDGTDGKPPIHDPTLDFRQIPRKNMFEGSGIGPGEDGKGKKKLIPNKGDWIWEDPDDPKNNKCFLCTGHDPITWKPILVLRSGGDSEGGGGIINENDGRFFIGRSSVIGCDKTIFYDDSTVVPTLSVPEQMHIGLLQTHHIKAFKGVNTSESGIEISARYDSSGNLVGTSIPLVAKAVNAEGKVTQWQIPTFECSHKLTEGEQIVIVMYNDKGVYIGREGFIVEFSSTNRDISDADLWIKTISLESFYISGSDENLLLIPEKTLANSINLFGRVHYSDGSSRTYPADGNRMELLYVDRASESPVGTTGTLVLKYYLANNEKSVHVTNVESNYFITRPYKFLITEREGAFSVKLYPVPIWVNDNIGYDIDWYLFSLDRNSWTDVTNQVYIADNSPTKEFNGKLYGPLQQLNVAVDLGKVNQTFERFIHPQQVDIRLSRPATDDMGNKWMIGYEPYQDPPYGRDLQCFSKLKSANHFTLDISQGLKAREEWLKQVYFSTMPQYRTNKEPEAPTPNMFAIIVGGTKGQSESYHEFPIAKWNTGLDINRPVLRTDTVKILFFKRYPDSDAYLSLAPMAVFDI